MADTFHEEMIQNYGYPE